MYTNGKMIKTDVHVIKFSQVIYGQTKKGLFADSNDENSNQLKRTGFKISSADDKFSYLLVFQKICFCLFSKLSP